MRALYSKFYKSQGFFWGINASLWVHTSDIDGPYCSNCRMDIEFPKEAYDEIDIGNGETYPKLNDEYNGTICCTTCVKKFKLKESILKIKQNVLRDYALKKRASVLVESLDELPSQVKVRDQDDKYFIAAKIGEKDGKRVGVVYFGEKAKEQNKKDYSQVFVDLDNDQVRFDKTNRSPKEIIAKMKIEFPEVSHEETYRKSKKSRRKA